MIFVGLVATEPATQGCGYGDALLEAINDIMNAAKLFMWLTSSNVLNDAFYNSHGFESIGTFYLGEGNPTWTEKPTPVQIRVQEQA
ncbi:hypothetical protein BDN70DRAFT_886388 [Pholiota conissans]|uniref:N-acetyltransferase domain-containing protein n=1 Tax=Pholiota conissans TaxID=109636 RepID=A0A9P5YNC8_9AGAR|nr:hypothetical protein BDN70DRAFT_886388 [Pholiota conissans]